MKEELKGKYVLPYFYKLRPPPSVQPHRSITHSSPPAKFTPSNQTMEFQPTLDDIMAKINNLLQIKNSSNQNSKSSISCVISTAREVKKSLIIIKVRTLKRTFLRLVPQLSATNVKVMSMLLPTVQVNLNCINDGVPIKAPKPAGTISLKVTPMTKEFTVTCPFPSLALLQTPPPLLPTPVIVTCFDHQLLPPLLLRPSHFPLWHMLGTKLKFSTDLIPLVDQYKVNESASPVASSFASHVHTPHDEISGKIVQNNVNHGITS